MSINVEVLTKGQFMGVMPFSVYCLPNGMSILLLQNEISPVVSSLLYYKVGSAYENDSQRGLAHFLEHMMFRETTSHTDSSFDRSVSRMGGVGLNAFTSCDATVYLVELPTNKLQNLLELEADRMANLKLDESQIDTERGAVLGEIDMYNDMPVTQIYDRMMEEAFYPHVYRHPVIGYCEQVRNFKQDDFKRFYRRFYSPNNAFLVIAGGFEEKQVIEWIWSSFAHLSASRPQEEALQIEPRTKSDPWKENRWVELKNPSVQTETLIVSWRSPGVLNADYPALTLMASWLGTGQSSPLYQELVLSGLVANYTITLQEQEMLWLDPALIIMDARLSPGVSSEQVNDKINKLLQKLVKNPPGSEDMARALNQLRLETYAVIGNNYNMSCMLGGGFLTQGDPLYWEKQLQNIEKVTAIQVQQVLQKWLLDCPQICVCQRHVQK